MYIEEPILQEAQILPLRGPLPQTNGMRAQLTIHESHSLGVLTIGENGIMLETVLRNGTMLPLLGGLVIGFCTLLLVTVARILNIHYK